MRVLRAGVSEMRRTKTLIAAKLKSSAGESLAEVLLSLLIAALAMAMLASVISTTANIITRNKIAVAEYYSANNCLEAHVAASNVDVLGTDPSNPRTITIVDNTNAKIRLFSAQADAGELQAILYKNLTVDKVDVVSYELNE